jgi:hypothetical protein
VIEDSNSGDGSKYLEGLSPPLSGKRVLNESRSSEATLRQIVDKIPTLA